MGDRSNKTRYYLIACGTSKYKNYEELDLDSVPTDIEKVVNLFTQNFGYEQVLTNFQLNPNAVDLKIQFANWLQNEERCETDCLIFYYSGHGEYLQGDKHYLLMENTEPNIIGQTALATEDLVRPLKNEGVKIAQILYIIDTCYSQSGAGDVTNFASTVIQQFQPVKGENIAVHSIAACRAKQTAQEGLFSQVLEKVIEDCSASGLKGGYIHPSDLVEKINQKILFETQHVVYNNVGSETSPKFFPILPKTLQTWEEKRHEFVQKLLCILKKKLDSSLFFINSFILSSKFIEEFVLDELELKEKLKNLSLKPVSDGICLLIACSEWCKCRFSDRNDTNKFNLTLAQELESWQTEVIKYRKDANLERIRQFVTCNFTVFKSKIKTEELRIQIEIQPVIDEKKNTGLSTGSFLLNMNLWMESEKLPLGRFAENVVLDLRENEEGAFEEDSNSLRKCLEKENFLSGLIREARYSLPETVKPKIEIFLPLDLYQESLENICFKFGRTKKELGKEYLIFINSFERYFHEDFREIRDAIYKKKESLWINDNNLEPEIYYIGTEPSENDLEMIEEAKAIAVWSRNDKEPLVEGDEGYIKISEWKNWPEKIHNLRKDKDLEITLFWDDLYPKPSRRCRPLNTKVVE
jgi:hypothetical protein